MWCEVWLLLYRGAMLVVVVEDEKSVRGKKCGEKGEEEEENG